MPVLVEVISVIVRRDAIDRSYPGGWQRFVSAVPNKTLCMDAQLARVGFMHPIDVRGFIDSLIKAGLTVQNSAGSFADLAVTDQRTGLTAPCDWIEILPVRFETGSIVVARLKGNTENSVCFPGGWTFEKSASRSIEFLPGVEPDENYEFLGNDNGVDVYRDRTNGRKVYIGRTTPP